MSAQAIQPLDVLICDDETIARRRLTDLLQASSQARCIGALNDPRRVIAEVLRLQPDVLLIDVEMPYLSGFDVIAALRNLEMPAGYHLPQIIFVTAHGDQAVQGFDAAAVDFLIKPVRLARLTLALRRARRHIGAIQSVLRLGRTIDEIAKLAALQARAPVDATSLSIKVGKEFMRVPLSDIAFIEAEGQYVRLHSPHRKLLHRESLASLDGRLRGKGFVRLHRSIIVRIDEIARIEPSSSGGKQARLLNGAALPIGRTYREALLTTLQLRS